MKGRIPFFIIALFLLSLILRLLYAFWYHTPPLGDGVEYHRLALSLLGGKGYVNENGVPISTYPPFHPFLLFLSYFFFGVHAGPVRWIQAGISALTVVWIYHLGVLSRGEPEGRCSGVVSACYIPLITYASAFWSLSENLFLFLLSWAVLVLYRLSKEPSFQRTLGCGVLFGLAAQVRAVGFLIPGMACGWLLWEGRRTGKPLFRWAVLLLLFFCVTITPWTVRNYLVHRAWIPIATDGSQVFWLGNHPSEKGFGFGNPEAANKISGRASEVEASRLFVEENLRFIRENPGEVARLSLFKFLWFWYPFDGDTHRLGSRYNYCYGVVFSLALLGVWYSRKRWKEDLFFYLFALYFFAGAMVTYGQPRFRLPIEPLLIIMGSWGILGLKDRWGARNAKLTVFGLAGAHLLLGVFSESLRVLGKQLLGGSF
ncbi:MAG: glycosyltransferase family 39 protein [Candidatus Omnitrophota bacterium]